MAVKIPMSIDDQQEAFDLLASLVEWQVEMGGFDNPVWDAVEEACNRLRDEGFERSTYLEDYYEAYVAREGR